MDPYTWFWFSFLDSGVFLCVYYAYKILDFLGHLYRIWLFSLFFLSMVTECSVNFEFMNYTVITSQCKGPKYPAKECCSSFKEFACPYAEQINDLSSDCANTMFSYINIYGSYPPGIFSNECQEGKKGLECPAMPPNSLADLNAAATTACSHVWMTISAVLLVVFNLFCEAL